MSALLISARFRELILVGVNGINSNPDFGIKDTVLICQGKRFKLDYSATDAEGDSLTYEFSPGYYGGGDQQCGCYQSRSSGFLGTLVYQALIPASAHWAQM